MKAEHKKLRFAELCDETETKCIRNIFVLCFFLIWPALFISKKIIRKTQLKNFSSIVILVIMIWFISFMAMLQLIKLFFLGKLILFTIFYLIVMLCISVIIFQKITDKEIDKLEKELNVLAYKTEHKIKEIIREPMAKIIADNFSAKNVFTIYENWEIACFATHDEYVGGSDCNEFSLLLANNNQEWHWLFCLKQNERGVVVYHSTKLFYRTREHLLLNVPELSIEKELKNFLSRKLEQSFIEFWNKENEKIKDNRITILASKLLFDQNQLPFLQISGVDINGEKYIIYPLKTIQEIESIISDYKKTRDKIEKQLREVSIY